MVLPLDENKLQRLLLAKMMLNHGLYHASLRDQLSRMLAVHHFDSASEIVMLILADISSEKFAEDNYREVLDKARRAFTTLTGSQTLPDESELVELHKVRNRVQHGAMTVDQSVVERFKTPTQHFISKILQDVWSKTLTQISAGEMIHNKELRTKIQAAEAHFNKAEFRECVNACEAVLVEATFETGGIIYKAGMLAGYWGGRTVRQMTYKRHYGSKFKGQSKRLATDLATAISEIGRITTSMQFLDNYRGEFLRHRDTMSKLSELSEKELGDAATASLDFVTNLLLKWQNEGILE